MINFKKNNITIKKIIILQLVIIIYTGATVMAKIASNYEILTKNFILFYIFEVIILAVYAILWQQVIKQFDLTVAYANRSMVLLWSMLWAVLFFGESITMQNIVGVVIVLTGIIVVNSNE